MKKYTKLLGIVLILALVMSMGTMAFAATITVTNNDPSTDENSTTETYTAYKT